MRSSRLLNAVDVHTAGEIGRVITAGVPPIPGATMAAKMRHINEVDGSLRVLLTSEPRASANATANILVPPTDPACHVGFIVLQPDRAHAMSGSNAICVTTALIETGMVPITGAMTAVELDTPAGRVTAMAECAEGRCVRVTLTMPESFCHTLDAVIPTKRFGPVRADIAFGGCFYALVDGAALGLSMDDARGMVAAGIDILGAANVTLDIRHPDTPEIGGISYVMLCFWDADTPGAMRNATILWPGRVDRSPCGTGTSARLAAMVARGDCAAGHRVAARSITGGRFEAAIVAARPNHGSTWITPTISGRGFLYGTSQILLDPEDPLQAGVRPSDLWGAG